MDFLSVNSYSLAFVSAQITKVWYSKAQVSENQWFQVDQKVVDLKVYSTLSQQGKCTSHDCDNIAVSPLPSHGGALRPTVSSECLCVSHDVKIVLSKTLTGPRNACVYVCVCCSLLSGSSTPLTPLSSELGIKHGHGKSIGLGVDGLSVLKRRD